MTASAYIPSPCIGICTLENSLCIGCFRTSDDILNWSRWTDAQREAALAQRDLALEQSFSELFRMDDESMLWQYWEQHLGWFQKPGSAIEAWLQVLLEADSKLLPDTKICGVSGRFALHTQQRKKTLDTWLARLQSLRQARTG
jgi:predicted Fe-S protein YdhL (DUF1289 family)